MVKNRDYVPVNSGDGDEEEGGYRDLEISHQPHDSDSTSKLHEDREDDVFQVKILDASGSIYPVDVTEDTTIGDLKQKVAMESGIEIERQRHIYLGKVLENHQMLKGVNAKPGCTIHLFPRPKEIIPHVPAVEREGEAIHINGTNGTSNSDVNTIFAFSLQLPGSSQPVVSIDSQTLELDDAVRGLLMISTCLLFLSILQSLRALVLLKQYFDEMHHDSEYFQCVSRGKIVSTCGSANFGLISGIWGMYGARVRQIQTFRGHLLCLAIAGIVLVAGRFFQLFLILTEQIPLSCFYNGKCSVKGSDYNNTSNCNTAEIAGDVVKVEILSLIVTSFFCVWCFRSSLRFYQTILASETALPTHSHSMFV
eukprot:471201_1